MFDGFYSLESHEAAQYFRYHGEVPDVVGKWVLVVRAGAPPKESWLFCDKDKIEKVRRKYQDRFVRVAGKVYIDRKPIRVAKTVDYVVQLSAQEEEILLASLEEPKPFGSPEWQDTKSKAPEYNPLLDIPKLAKGISKLSENERKVFDLWNEGKSQYAVQAVLKIERSSLLAYRDAIRRKLKDYLVATDAKDFERRVQAIHPTVKKLVDVEIKKYLIAQQAELEERRKAAEQEKIDRKRRLVELREIAKQGRVSERKEVALQKKIDREREIAERRATEGQKKEAKRNEVEEAKKISRQKELDFAAVRKEIKLLEAAERKGIALQKKLDKSLPKEAVHKKSISQKVVSPLFQIEIDFPHLANGILLLTPSELVFFNHWIEGKTTKELQAVLNYTRGTVHTHKKNVKNKLNSYIGTSNPVDFQRAICGISAEQRHYLASLVSQAKDAIHLNGLPNFNPSEYVSKMANALPLLTKSERRFFDQWISGGEIYDIERNLSISQNTAKDYQKIIRSKLTPFIGATSPSDFNDRFAHISKDLVEYLDANRVQPTDTIDPARLVQGLANLDSKERKYFDLLLDGTPLQKILDALHMPNGAHLSCVSVIKRKLNTYLPDFVMSDFDAQIKLIGPDLKKQLASVSIPERRPGGASMPAKTETHAAVHAPIPEAGPPTPTITFNDFIQAYGNRKDALKALEQFNKIPAYQRPLIMEDIAKYKASLVNASYQISPYQYLSGKSWMNY